MNKKGFQLSINMLVVIILSIVLFGVGIVLLAKIIGVGGDKIMEIDDKIILEMRESAGGDSLTSVYSSLETIPRGESGGYVLRIVNEGEVNNFFVDITATNTLTSDMISYIPGPYNLARNKDTFVLIAVNIPKNIPKGQHSFDITVSNDDVALYDKIHRLYVKVP